MKKRSISIFIERVQLEEVEAFRKKFDYLYSVIPPHITLVFPFESKLTTEECIEHLSQTLKKVQPFSITLNDFHIADDHCLFYLVDEGKEQICAIHNRLYTKKLVQYQSENQTYIPHVTIGRFISQIEASEALELAKQTIIAKQFWIKKIVLEIIGPNDDSIVEHIFKLNDNQ
ncbi:2'-5' RNA ligase family protein [Alkalihalobacillus sp. AL-G]|uniref:2'-5' RNA ligase family protein n=1 Tax=Alkalihalobacillus sp. AL-G TaxID=2926399 RepID=UPI00272B960F|nr:2'-5' RNA ligase family protein [Alkalihalobacillus sp. AL-G]WLD91551.1 2'-5' RNA ligase family protein [Alkalihalobacillus sp. AL-G]